MEKECLSIVGTALSGVQAAQRRELDLHHELTRRTLAPDVCKRIRLNLLDLTDAEAALDRIIVREKYKGKEGKNHAG